MPISDDLIEAMNKTNSYDKKIQVIHLNGDHSITQDDHSNNHYEECHTPINNTNDPEDKNQDELDRSLQPNSVESRLKCAVSYECSIIS